MAATRGKELQLCPIHSPSIFAVAGASTWISTGDPASTTPGISVTGDGLGLGLGPSGDNCAQKNDSAPQDWMRKASLISDRIAEQTDPLAETTGSL